MKSTHPDANHEQIVVDSDYNELDKVVDAAYNFFSSFSEDMDLIHKVMLLTSEAATNGMKHGNKLSAEKTVKIEFACTAQSMEVWVEDEGDGFVPTNVPDPLADEHLMDEGGRGIFLIEELADEVRYEKEGRRIGMIFRVPSEQ